ncbi:dTDP-4-dehydrorhamnose 3,5-epimerase [Mucilaginibacter sp. HD30]
MNLIKTPLDGCVVIEPRIFNDSRGYFFESFNQKKFTEATGHNLPFVQDNQSFSPKGTLRGLHLQRGEHAQSKLVRVSRGEVLDVAVDLRSSSATYGQYFSVILSESNNRQLFVPRGFAHGFVVLSDFAVFQYKCDNYYNKSAEGGIHFTDAKLNIDWKFSADDLTVSDTDKELPFLTGADDFGF